MAPTPISDEFSIFPSLIQGRISWWILLLILRRMKTATLYAPQLSFYKSEEKSSSSLNKLWRAFLLDDLVEGFISRMNPPPKEVHHLEMFHQFNERQWDCVQKVLYVEGELLWSLLIEVVAPKENRFSTLYFWVFRAALFSQF